MDAGNQEFGKCRKNVMDFCKSNGINLHLQYIDLRKMKKDMQYNTELSETIVPNDLNWFGRPDPERISIIADNSYDLYICLSDSDSFCVEYISKCVKSKFKIGITPFENSPFDMTVSSPDGSNGQMAEIFNVIKNLIGKIG